MSSKKEINNKLINVKKNDIDYLAELTRQMHACAMNLARATENTNSFCLKLKETSPQIKPR